ncbi:response regulator transcription factor [Streptomyces sp. NPDC001339]|uniref:response regulator transcription factor n=1 Tax=Streptomyces sp. NPDC001339 TaxID=3364563 RepID=UPI00368BBB9A
MPTAPTPIECLTPAEARVAGKVALGLTSSEIADTLRLAKGTVDAQVRHALHKLGVHNRAALIHRCYVREQLPRPERSRPLTGADAAEIDILWLLAGGAGYAEIAQHSTHGLSHHSTRERIKALRVKWEAQNDPHLITRAWVFGVLAESRPMGEALRLRGEPAVLR